MRQHIPSALTALCCLLACKPATLREANKDAGVPVCGNGVVEMGEECDDGNTDPTGTCVSCKIVQCGGQTFQTPAADPQAPYDVVSDFTVPTTGGNWTFKDHYTGCDSYIFIRQSSKVTYSQQLWAGTFDELLQNSPLDVHYFYFSDDPTAATEAQTQDGHFQAWLSEKGSAANAWKYRVHIINVPTSQLTGWIPAMLAKQGFITFAVDHQQRLRETGLLASPLSTTLTGDVSYLSYQVQAFDFEFNRLQQLAAEKNVTVVPVTAPVVTMDGGTPSSPGTVDVELPPADVMAGFDTMEFDLMSDCGGHLDMNCPAWDQIGSLIICSETPQANCGNGTVDTGEDCDDGASNGAPGDPCTRFCENANAPLHVCNQGQEIGRWITTYARIGHWVTDTSPFLGSMSSGGKRRFQYNSGGGSMATLSIRLRNMGASGHRPKSIQYMWGGGGFGPNYNSQHMPITFTVPSGMTQVLFVAYITGHGWGQNAENCAEFCDTTHEISVNGHAPHVKDAPLAGTDDGCAQQVVNGNIPNQYGTWPLGRDGWCPGLDVKPWVVDITSEVNLTGSNTISYEGLYNGMNYTPGAILDPNPSGFGAQISMSSYLVFGQ
jgi:cysteine-rich repeat protein